MEPLEISNAFGWFFAILFLIILIIYSAVPFLCFVPSAAVASINEQNTHTESPVPVQNIRQSMFKDPGGPENLLEKAKKDITDNFSKFQQSFQYYTIN